MNADNAIRFSLNRLQKQVKGFRNKMPDQPPFSGRSSRAEMVAQSDPAAAGDAPRSAMKPAVTGYGARNSGLRELVSNTLEFDIGSLLQLRSFLYLLAGTGIFLFQTHNTLAIINLALENEKLREQIQMTSSVLTSQELKVHELQSIHNIAQDAAELGLIASSIPAVELRP